MPASLLSTDIITVRACTSADIAAVTVIYRHAVLTGTGTFEIDPPDETEMAARHTRIVRAGYPYVVAIIDGEVAGYAYAYAYRDRPAYRFMVEDSVYVAQAHQRRGVGRALLPALIDEVQTRGFRQMVAVIGDGDNIGSIRLHRAFGFADVGTLKAAGWKAGRWLDVVLMQRGLGPGAASPPV